MIQLSTWAGGTCIQTSSTNPFQFEWIKKLLLATKGRPFRISFIRRTDGVIRHMKALVPEKKEGGKPKYNAEEYKLLPVIDLEKKGWRSIPLDGVFSFEFIFPEVFKKGERDGS